MTDKKYFEWDRYKDSMPIKTEEIKSNGTITAAELIGDKIRVSITIDDFRKITIGKRVLLVELE